MWRGFGAETDSEPLPAQRSYFRPRIQSISGVLAMTKQRLFTMAPRDDPDQSLPAHTASIHPVTAMNHHHSHHSHHLNLNDPYLLNGALGLLGARCPSPARSSSWARCSSATAIPVTSAACSESQRCRGRRPAPGSSS